MSMSMRVLSRVGARELTSEEVDQVSGSAVHGTRIPVTSFFPPTVDGIITD